MTKQQYWYLQYFPRTIPHDMEIFITLHYLLPGELSKPDAFYDRALIKVLCFWPMNFVSVEMPLTE